MEFVGPEGLLDPGRYFVILVDALGDGISSSPSNSSSQPRMRFPRFSIRDMVRSQHALLTRVLGLSRLHAVVGVSMGAMQAFEWIVSYPEWTAKAVPIHGTPRMTSYDLLLWTAELRAIQADPQWQGGDYLSPPRSGMGTVAAINSLALTTPRHRVAETPVEEFDAYLQEVGRSVLNFDANNWIRQLQAMMGHDVTSPFGGSLEAAARQIQAEVLVVVVDRNDHMVRPEPSLQLARILLAPTLELDSPCGHLAV